VPAGTVIDAGAKNRCGPEGVSPPFMTTTIAPCVGEGAGVALAVGTGLAVGGLVGEAVTATAGVGVAGAGAAAAHAASSRLTVTLVMAPHRLN